MSPSAFQDIVPESRVHQRAMLSNYTSMRTGGPADYLIEAASEDEICAVFEQAQKENIPVYIMGNGSNLIFSDEGFRGVVLHIGKAFSSIKIDSCSMDCQAGAMLAAVSREAAEHALSGMEFAAGIPGSVGGAVCMNAGAYGGEISQVLEHARVLVNGNVERWTLDQLQFGYRHSAIMDQTCTVLSAQFILTPGNREDIRSYMRDLNDRRRQKQPLQYPSCGSFFKRPAGHYAGALIEQAGLKGFAIGDAQVSELHAGFVINRGHATSQDIYRLMRHVQHTVFEQSGVLLEPEVKLIGRFEA